MSDWTSRGGVGGPIRIAWLFEGFGANMPYVGDVEYYKREQGENSHRISLSQRIILKAGVLAQEKR